MSTFSADSILESERVSRNRSLFAWARVGVGVGFLCVAYLIFYQSGQFIIRLNGQVVTYPRADYPITFNAAAATALLIGLYHLIRGAWFVIHKEAKPAIIAAGNYSVFWAAYNAATLLLFTWLGYSGIPLTVLRDAEPKWVLCGSAFVVFLFVIPSLLYFAAASTFRKPQWGRSPLNWWHDPLQVFFIATWSWLGLLVGTLLRLFLSHLTDRTSMWSVLIFVAAFAGLLAGQAIGYVRYKHRIDT